MYKGELPCIGCGKSGKEVPRQSKDCLCNDCANALKIGMAVVKERNLESKSYCLDDFKVGTIKWYTYTDDVENALINLLNTFSQFKETSKIWGFPESLYYNKLCSSLGASHEVILPTETFEAAKRLCEVLKELNDDLKEKSKTYKAVLDKELAEKRNKLYKELAEKKNEIHHCSKKEVDLTDITNGCFNFIKREVVDDIPHNPEAKSTGLYDCRGQELFEGGYFMIPNSYFDRQRVAIIRWDKQYKDWRLEDQPPFDGCLRNTLGEHVINVLPWITQAGYKVTEKRIINMYK